MAITDFIFTPVLTSEVEYDVVGERGGRWTLFQRGCTYEDAVVALEEARSGGPSATWHLVRRTTAVTEELMPSGAVEEPASGR
ncbi:hypothetical protein OG218_00170 [Kineococcus sp. NBC_00420]|uniref:hypothetical protein n=1 Tax=Kineococcus sp. NBC_00420 TaxID=2903564 RepID=UPI002E1D36EC